MQTLSPLLLSSAANDRVSVENKSIGVTLRKRVVAGNPSSTELYLIAANVAHKAPAVQRHFLGVPQTDVRIVLKDVADGQAEIVGTPERGRPRRGGRCQYVREFSLTRLIPMPCISTGYPHAQAVDELPAKSRLSAARAPKVGLGVPIWWGGKMCRKRRAGRLPVSVFRSALTWETQ